MEFLSNFTHEIASLIIGGLVSWVWAKVKRAVKDVQAFWDSLHCIEKRLEALEALNNVKGDPVCKNSSTVSPSNGS